MARRASSVRWSQVVRNQIHLNTAAALNSTELRSMVARKSRQLRDDAIGAGQTSGSVYTTYTDGIRGAAEETVPLQGGIIRYVFSEIAQAANWALSECRRRSPVGQGNFRDSWVVLVDGKAWTDAPATIPTGSEVWITNTTPYSRKIEVGGQRTRIPPGLIEAVRQATMRRFKSVRAAKAYKALQGGKDARGDPVPYILRAAGVASGLTWDKKAKSWARKHDAYTSRRPDRQAGQQLLYPTLILTNQRM
ncbi:hypothetical protein HLH26_07250 [Gluconacetobacter sp. 1b LMG 1731]|uniref:Uncharacterized protein n=1 Tax=Gluconacetobacter dulcium TaxID=2729096 RepID=A0A7W4NVF0_9PROT|nr:hypothetical protein [Gluconacetobacter dulcium]MBB2164340.1 hypothetical protein [Gluconacetobacter dulcium]MBB2193590.1 hypothetical protein [Gluconacetobacter dulcium]